MIFPRPKTVGRALSPMIFVNWIFGIGVLEYPLGRPRPRISAWFSALHLTIALTLLVIADLPSLSTFQGSAYAANNYRAWVYLSLLSNIICLCIGHLRAKNIRSVVTRMALVTEDMRKLGISDGYDAIFNTQVRELSISTLLISCVMVIDLIYVGHDFNSITKRISFILTCHYMLTFDIIVAWSITVGVRYLGTRFEAFNEFIDSKVRRTDSVERRESMTDAWQIRKVHRDLTRLAKEFNEAFSMQILLSLTFSFILVTSVSFTAYVLSSSYDQKSSGLMRLMNTIAPISWAMVESMKALSLIHTCSTTSKESQKTGQRIHGLLPVLGNIEDRAEITIFSLQLIQNRLVFSARGFFSLNHSMVTEMLGTIVTFLIIMIQMHVVHDTRAN